MASERVRDADKTRGAAHARSPKPGSPDSLTLLAAAALAALVAGGFLVVPVGSVVVLVPIQRRLVASESRAGRPIRELPELGTVEGVADIGFALEAWFVDPHRNWIDLLQFKESRSRSGD